MDVPVPPVRPGEDELEIGNREQRVEVEVDGPAEAYELERRMVRERREALDLLQVEDVEKAEARQLRDVFERRDVSQAVEMQHLQPLERLEAAQ